MTAHDATLAASAPPRAASWAFCRTCRGGCGRPTKTPRPRHRDGRRGRGA